MALARLLPGARKSPARAGPDAPYTGCQKRPSLGPHPLRPWPPASLRIWHCRGSRDPSSHTTSMPCPHWGRPKSSKAASGPDSVGGPHAEVGIKPKLNPRDGATKEEDQKPFHQLHKLQIKSPRSAR